jgi:hypothetical protein
MLYEHVILKFKECILFFAFCILTQLNVNAQSRGLDIKISEPSKTKATTYAIVIGISKYKNLPHLQYADKDAKVFADYLTSPAGMNLPARQVNLLAMC